MSLQQQQQRPEPKDQADKRVGFFIDRDSERPPPPPEQCCCWDGPGGAGDHHHHHQEQHDAADHHRLILQQADALASVNRLREAVDCFSAAMRLKCGNDSVRPEHLSTLVDCILHNFKTKLLPPPPTSIVNRLSVVGSRGTPLHQSVPDFSLLQSNFPPPPPTSIVNRLSVVGSRGTPLHQSVPDFSLLQSNFPPPPPPPTSIVNRLSMVGSRGTPLHQSVPDFSLLQSNFPPRHAFSSSSSSSSSSSRLDHDGDDDMFDCPSCRRFLAQPVTVACGHSYCRRCLERRMVSSRCKVCSEETSSSSSSSSSSRVNVVLCGLLEKWFPGETDACKVISDIEELSRRKHLEEAVSLASRVIASAGPGLAAVVARLSRAEAYVSLRRYRLALEDTEVYLSSRQSAEGFYQKAIILQTMGQMDEALQVFLHCLAVDEDFPHARRHVEMILFDLLSPAAAGEKVKVCLRETAQSTSPHPRSKTLVVDGASQAESQPPPQHQSSVQVRAASAHHYPESDHHKRSGRSESLERPALSRAHSLRTHDSFSCGEEGLKRVCSAPQLGDQEKGSLLKRKLSVSDAGPCVVNSGGRGKKKQGAGVSCQPAAAARACRAVPQDLLDANDLECSLCMRLFYEPVTTPCGHTFCKTCLERCLDHTLLCPLCKDTLKEYLASRKYTVTHVLDQLIKRYLRQEHEQRTKIHQEENRELSDLRKNVPIFVCTMAYPTVPCPLHVFEPRYRLMIRRCMDTGTRTFGMCISDPEKGFVDHGCMLIIRSVHFLPDGRSVVDTVGGKRFQVVSRGTRDGYSTADIQHLEDTRVEEEAELLGLQGLHDAVYEQARVWFHSLKVRFHNQILQHFGAMPEREADIQATPNGPACCWWLLAVLPIDPRYQLSVLSMTSLRERLVKIQHILTYLQSIPDD